MEIFTVLAETDEKNSALHLAVMSQNHEMCAQFLRNGVDPHSTNNRDHTPLHVACIVGDPVLVSLLLKHSVASVSSICSHYFDIVRRQIMSNDNSYQATAHIRRQLISGDNPYQATTHIRRQLISGDN